MRMHNLFAVALAAAALIWAAPGVSLGAESGLAAPDIKAQTDLEKQVQDLQKRVKDLEDQIANGAHWGATHNFGLRQGNLDQTLERFKNELERDLGAGQSLVPPAMGGMGMEPFAGQPKPRLGVSLAEPSVDLGKRFDNQVKEGAFVMSLVPGSPAEKAGINVGDAIVSFDKKDVKAPEDLIGAVQNAPKGRNEISVMRKGQQLMLNVELGAPEETEALPGPAMRKQGFWLRRGAPSVPGNESSSTRTEVKASALELSGQLIKDLKLSDEQQKKMTAVLTEQGKALSDDVAAEAETSMPGNGEFAVSYGGGVSKLVDQHVAAAEKELSGVLSAEQMQTWKTYRQAHNSISVLQSTVIEGSSGDVDPHTGF